MSPTTEAIFWQETHLAPQYQRLHSEVQRRGRLVTKKVSKHKLFAVIPSVTQASDLCLSDFLTFIASELHY